MKELTEMIGEEVEFYFFGKVFKGILTSVQDYEFGPDGEGGTEASIQIYEDANIETTPGKIHHLSGMVVESNRIFRNR